MMMKQLVTLLICSCLSVTLPGQSFQEEYAKFKKGAAANYASFREKANAQYADFVRNAWKSYGEGVTVKHPKDEMLPPVIADDEPTIDEPVVKEDTLPIHDRNSFAKPQPIALQDRPITIKDVVLVPSPQPQPLPVEPIRENPIVDDTYTTSTLYGTVFKARFPDNTLRLPKVNPNHIADAWQVLSKADYDNTIRDCLENRIRYNLSDWTYLRMLTSLCDERYGAGTPEAELVKAYIFSQSGYKMRLAMADDRLVMLYGSPYLIYGKLGWQIDGMRFYCDNEKVSSIYICEASFPGERPLSTAITTQQVFTSNNSDDREIKSSAIAVNSSVNSNYIAFCNDFPTSQYGDDDMTRWAIYANTPASPEMVETLYPQLRAAIEGKTDFDAVNALCRWIQTAFVYEYDNVVWGRDRAFFADETLYYPYCDCEDRSILLTRIVRDLLNIDCVLIYYPGHLATAIALGEEARGDFIRYKGVKFIVCDPTYINASIGRTMPGMDNSTATAIPLLPPAR